MVALLDALQPGILRYPGGARAMRWHFAETIGPEASRKPQCDPLTGTTDATTFGLHEALVTAELLGTELALVSAWVDGSPEEAAAMIAYARAEASSTTPIGVDARGIDWGTAGRWGALRETNGHPAPFRQVVLLEVGDAPYLDRTLGPPTSCGRATAFTQAERWEGDRAIATSAADYAAQVKKTGALVRAIAPEVLVGAAAYASFDGTSDAAKELGGVDRKLGSGDAWNARLVADARDGFGAFVLHPREETGETAGDAESQRLFADRLRKVILDLRAIAADKQVVISDYAVAGAAGSLRDALVTADVTRVAIEEQAFAAMRNLLVEDDPAGPSAASAAIAGADHHRTIGFEVMRILGLVLKPQVVRVEGARKDVFVLATIDDAGTNLGIVVIDRRSETEVVGPTRLDVTLPRGSYVGRKYLVEGAPAGPKVSETGIGASGTLRIDAPARALLAVSLSLQVE
jgi:hypothetical protein